MAAGQSRRMGQPKLCLPVEGNPLGSMALDAAVASSLDGIAVVTRADDPMDWIPSRMTADPYRRRWIQVPCESSPLGMAESLKCGLRAAHCRNATAVLVLLADQPFVSSDMIDALIAQYRDGVQANKAYIAAEYEGIVRPPVLFGSGMFAKLLRLEGDAGARNLIQGEGRERGLAIGWHDAACFLDIDTRDDYDALLGGKGR